MDDGAARAQPPFDPATGEWLPAQRSEPVPPDAPRHGPGPFLWSVLLGIDLAVLGASLVYTILGIARGGGTLGPVDRRMLWGLVAFNLVTLGLIPFAWVAGTRVEPWRGAVRYLHLERPVYGLLWGAVVGVATLGLLVAAGILLKRLGYNPSNQEADAILDAITPRLALALAAGAAIGEELFFRGLLQRRLGVWGQALLFGLFHLSYGTVLQVVFPALLGLLYGVLVKRGFPLWTTMAAHFVFDYVQLSSPFWLPK